MDEHETDYLEHYGVLGMKWGIRRFQPYAKNAVNKGKFIGNKTKEAIGNKTKESMENAKTSYERSKQINADNKLVKQALKNPSKLTNDELAIAMNRANQMKTAQLATATSQINTSKKASIKAAKNSSKLTDAELDYRINRMEREKRLKDATADVNKKDRPILKAAEKASLKVVQNSIEKGLNYAAGSYFNSIGLSGVAKSVFEYKKEETKKEKSPKDLNDLVKDVMKDSSKHTVDEIKEATDYIKTQQDFESTLKKNNDLYKDVKKPENQKALPPGRGEDDSSKKKSSKK